MSRILTIGQLWPGITPMNVYDMEYRVWVSMALSCDAQVAEREKQAAELRSRGR